jgi:hypothetical protein
MALTNLAIYVHPLEKIKKATANIQSIVITILMSAESKLSALLYDLLYIRNI